MHDIVIILSQLYVLGENILVFQKMSGVCLQLLDLYESGVCNVFVCLFRNACYKRLFAWIRLKFFNLETFVKKVKFDHFSSLYMIKSDFDATCTFADSFEVVFINKSFDNVLAATNFFKFAT